MDNKKMAQSNRPNENKKIGKKGGVGQRRENKKTVIMEKNLGF